MKIEWLNNEIEYENSPSVTSSQIFAKKGFHPDGLFSERIFGPMKNCTCSCGTYWGRSRIGHVCPTCGVTIDSNSSRRRNMAKIELPFPIINPIMFYLIDKVGKATMTNIAMSMVFDDSLSGYYFDDKKERYIKVKKPTIEGEAVVIPDGCVLYSGPQGIFNIITAECERNKDNDKNWKHLSENMDKFWMTSIGVIPPEFRPVSKSKDVQMRDKMNEYYITILNFVDIYTHNIITDTDSDIFRSNFRTIQKYVFDLYDYIFAKFSKKTGLIRGSILGKRIDFSGRAVISVDPELELDQCSIPYVMALEFYKLQVVNRLIEMKTFNNVKFVRYDPALKFVDKCIDNSDFCLYDVVKDIATDKLIMLNRQPTLHRMGLLSFRCLVNKENVIRIHPFACEPYNADFDGDQMAAYISLYPATEESNRKLIYVMSNLISPSTGDLCLGVNQDVVLGLYLLTKDPTLDVAEVSYKDKIIKTTQGRITFNKALPVGFPFINDVITKKKIHAILNTIAKRCTPEITKRTLDNIKVLGFSMTTKIGSTFSLKDLTVTDSTTTAISEILDNPNMSTKDKFFALQNHPLKQEIIKTFPYSDFIESGSRGTWDQALQLIFCKGYVSNSKGQVVPIAIKNNLIKGLTKEEFFISCYGARKALLDVALNTAVSGYLTRKLVYCCVNSETSEEVEDCGTNDYFEVQIPQIITEAIVAERTQHITDPEEKLIAEELVRHENDNIDPVKLARSLRNRWYLDESDGQLKLITDDNYLTFCGKTVKLRSPIYCKSNKVCKKCYGESSKYNHSKYSGVIAAQALGEVATQLTLRTFHVGGIAHMKEDQKDDSQQDIINDLNVVKRLLHNTDKINRPAKDIIMQLFSIYSRHKVLLLVHFELVISQVMRIGSIRWRLHPQRAELSPTIASIEQVPAMESFLLALAFSKPHKYIVDGILRKSQNSDGILEKMMINKA